MNKSNRKKKEIFNSIYNKNTKGKLANFFNQALVSMASPLLAVAAGAASTLDE